MNASRAESPGVLAPQSERVLGFDAVRTMLAGWTQSELGSAEVARLAPLQDREEVERRQSVVEQARDLAEARGLVPLAPARPIDAELAAVSTAGVVLDADGLQRVAAAAHVADQLRGVYSSDPEIRPLLAALVEDLPSLRPLWTHIDGLLDDEGQVVDHASPELRRLRKGIRHGRQDVRQRLDRLARDPAWADVLQEQLVTERGGRLVVPVRAGQRDRLRGVVHDASSSGQTLFVEPLDVLEEQNRVAELVGREREEVRRLLAEASAHVAAARDTLQLAQTTIARADALQGFARWADAQAAVRPEFTDGAIDLQAARHPLVGRGDFVPLDLGPGEEAHGVVITGPNTGGKTVALRTLGLLAAMAQCGLPVTARRARLPMLPRIHADIGDEQSLAASLSTFSGHLANIAAFLADSPPGSLVLLDELGTGTDPAEGAALGIALLERFLDSGAVVFVSTHHDSLKSFAHQRADVVNAAMEFDSETLEPTYRVRLGSPGRSNALDIAAGLGLDADIVRRARELLSPEALALDTVIRDVEGERDRLAESRERADEATEAAEQERLELEARREQLGADRLEMRRQIDAAVKAATGEIRAEGQRRLAELESSAGDSETTRADRRAAWAASTGEIARQARKKARRQMPAAPEGAAPGSGTPEPEAGPLARGEPVEVAPFGVSGSVLRDWAPGDEGVEVDAGGKRLVVHREQVIRRSEPASSRRAGGMRYERRFDVATEIDLHGMRVDEALAAVDKYLDDAILAELSSVRLIHGFGSGRLRGAIQEYLRGRPGVARFGAADPSRGGAGATVVELGD